MAMQETKSFAPIVALYLSVDISEALEHVVTASRTHVLAILLARFAPRVRALVSRPGCRKSVVARFILRIVVTQLRDYQAAVEGVL